MESQRYKSLHSQLLLQSVLMVRLLNLNAMQERDLQIERKNSLIQMKRQKSDIGSNNPFLKSSQEEAQQLEVDRVNRIQIADYQKSQIERKKSVELTQKKVMHASS